jgi:hypothetical protein
VESLEDEGIRVCCNLEELLYRFVELERKQVLM